MMAQVLQLLAAHRHLARMKQVYAELDEQHQVQRRHRSRINCFEFSSSSETLRAGKVRVPCSFHGAATSFSSRDSMFTGRRTHWI